MATNEKENVDEVLETYYKIEKSLDGLRYMCNTYDLNSNELIASEEVCGAFNVKNVEVNVKSGKKTFIMEYYDTLINDYTKFKCSYLDLSEKKIDLLFDEHGITIDKGFIKYMSYELQRITREFKSYNLAIEQAGFNDDLTEFYTNNKITVSDIKPIVQSDAFKNCLGPKGDKKKYDEMLKSLQDSVEMQLALSLGFSATTSAYVSGIVDCGNLVFGLVGKSSMGKSTASALISSVFSSTKYRATEGFARTAYSTALSLTEVMKHISGIPVLIDDLSANFKGNPENLIYSIEAGESKGHMNKDYTMAETGHWAGAFIINSEREILPSNCKEGARVRLLSFNDVAWTKNAEQSQLIKSVTQENYGFYGEKYVRNILKHGRDYVADLVKCYSMKFKEMLGKCDGFTDRISFKIGVILASAELANEILNGVLSISIDDIMNILINIETANYAKRNVYQTATEDIKKWLKDNVNTFNSSINKIENAYGVYESINVNGKKEEYYYVKPDIIASFFDNKAYSKERGQIMGKWINNSVIISGTEKDRNTVRKAVNGKITRCYKFNF